MFDQLVLDFGYVLLNIKVHVRGSHLSSRSSQSRQSRIAFAVSLALENGEVSTCHAAREGMAEKGSNVQADGNIG